jgi:hypothetical protein
LIRRILGEQVPERRAGDVLGLGLHEDPVGNLGYAADHACAVVASAKKLMWSRQQSAEGPSALRAVWPVRSYEEHSDV